MKLVRDALACCNYFGAYGVDWVEINGERQQGSLLVTPDVLQPWRPTDFSQLQREDFQSALAWQPEVVLLATGSRIRLPHPALYRDLIDVGVGMEVMDVGAVCRTFNALAGDGRSVVALVLFN